MSETFKNPVIWADVPDLDIIRVGDTYYMTSTTMYFTPGCPVMRSKDLVNWEIINYVYDILDDNDHMNLQNGKHDYGRGSWASCLRFHGGIFYVAFAAYNTDKTYVFQTEDIENGKWKKFVIDGVYHDMSILFDDGKVFMVYGAGEIKIIELTADVTAIKPGGMNKTIIKNADPTGGNGLAEGSHIYKINGFYYIFIISWPKNRRRIQVCYRCEKIDGDYECKIILDDNIGFQNAGVAQGGIVQTVSGEWFAMLFQDHGAVGRIPVVLPVDWVDNWPLPRTTEKVVASDVEGIIKSDEFDDETLNLKWQWNHNPVNSHWSFRERAGWLRLTTPGVSRSLSDAKNTLTQRTFGPKCTGILKADVSNMKNGDIAGLAALQDQYGFVGVKMTNNEKHVIMAAAPEAENYEIGIPETEIEAVKLMQDLIFFRVDFNFKEAIDEADFYFSPCGKNWTKIGCKLKMSYRLTHFTGYRFAIFNFATKEAGGYVDFDWFKGLDTQDD
jgi:beta-xylosidase